MVSAGALSVPALSHFRMPRGHARGNGERIKMYEGVNASEGIGIGTVVVAAEPDLSFEPHAVEDTAAEKARYQAALDAFCAKTQAQADRMKITVGENEAEIMSGHIMLAQDPGMTDGITTAIDLIKSGLGE